jgi:glycosyltransferase involved in cell wall biosynthesis
MKHVLVDLHRLKYNPYNGLYRFSVELGQALSRMKLSGLQLDFYIPEKDFGIFGPQASYVKHKSVDKFYRFGTAAFDVWHATTTLSWYRPFNRKTKFLFTVHDLVFLEEAERDKKHKERYLNLIRRRVERAHFLTYISEYSRQQAEQFFDIKDKPGVVIYNGCNIPPHKEFSQPAYVPRKQFLFSIGLFMSRKNFHVLPALLRNNDYELVLAGINDLPYKDEVLESARRMGVLDRVKLVGPVPEEEKFWYYQHCEAFVFPSINEGFGLPVIEAMWFGKPVFLSRETCLPEIGGDVAYYFNDFSPEAMQSTFEAGMKHYRESQPMQRIRERAASFSWEKAASEYVEVYRRMMNGEG